MKYLFFALLLFPFFLSAQMNDMEEQEFAELQQLTHERYKFLYRLQNSDINRKINMQKRVLDSLGMTYDTLMDLYLQPLLMDSVELKVPVKIIDPVNYAAWGIIAGQTGRVTLTMKLVRKNNGNWKLEDGTHSFRVVTTGNNMFEIRQLSGQNYEFLLTERRYNHNIFSATTTLIDDSRSIRLQSFGFERNDPENQ